MAMVDGSWLISRCGLGGLGGLRDFFRRPEGSFGLARSAVVGVTVLSKFSRALLRYSRKQR